ncbi:MAG TPA: VOC family protein [Novosphingobium sp.]|nr:VOC family protein [Novosphingobium sp.]
MALQGAWIWYELMTSDAAGARAFYEAVLGWHVAPGTQPPLFYGHIARADGEGVGGMLPLSPDMAAQGARPGWIGYIGVDDVDAAIARVEAAGGKVLMPRMDIDEGSFALVTDSGGAAFYVMTPRAMGTGKKSLAFSPTEEGSCGWNELYAADDEAALAFYTDLLGWTQPGAMDMGGFGSYRFLAHDGETFGAMMKKPPHAPVSKWNFYFRVADIDSAHTTLVEHGGQVTHGPVQVPGGDWVINATDPQGASFALVGKKAA